ncbi:DUF1850 domain-containing protein [Bosea sp. 685]|uniref:DUF1850 domain-containing protein n=1 Tax=Bosea sp. 685 TaxID=3080057 RepID=UPI002893492A|nr:DUF1850 domain-containing protein [Bosea sp. 685]WNJ91249.1 DUF1850 domain-containing protein [Bosea sp. 685]
MSLCLAAGALVIALGSDEITLSWRHSVQKSVWEELWRNEPDGMRLIEARIQGSGAGMDPPTARSSSTASGAGRRSCPYCRRS